MSSIRQNAPVAAPTSTISIPAKLSAQIDLLVSLQLWSWPALTVAIQNAWGGSPQVSKDKRDWFAGAVAELIVTNQLQDISDLEEVLLQVMVDEFEVVVDDDTAEEIARKIWKGCEKLKDGDVSEIEELYKKWEEKQGTGEKRIEIVRGEDQGSEDEWDDEDDEEWEGLDDGDVVMAEVTEKKEKIQPEVDEEGFTKVMSKKKK